MNDKQIKAFIKTGVVARKQIGDGLYIRVQTIGKAYWEVRYSINGKRRFMRIAGGQYPSMSLAVAKLEAALVKQKTREGVDPLAERARENELTIKTVNQLFDDWYIDLSKRLKFPNIPKRIYEKEIKPLIGDLAIEQVNARDIRAILQKVSVSGRPSIANDTLAYCKQLFNHACKLDLANSNPASAFKISDAGGIEKSRTRILDISELEIVFHILRDNSHIFTITADEFEFKGELLKAAVFTEITQMENERKEIETRLAKNQNPFPRAENFSVHEIIDPRETRKYLSDWVERIQPQLNAKLLSLTPRN